MFATVITRIIIQLRFATRPANNVPPGQAIRRALIGVAANSSNPIAVVMPAQAPVIGRRNGILKRFGNEPSGDEWRKTTGGRRGEHFSRTTNIVRQTAE